MNTSFYSLILLVSLSLIVVSISLFVNYQKLKLTENSRLQYLVNEINIEKKISKNLEEKKTEVKQIRNKIDYQFLKIKTLVFNLDFSLNEIFS